MNKDDLASTANEALKVIIKTVGETKDFVVAQSPDVVRQYITWGMINAAFGFLFATGMTYILVRLGLYMWNKEGDDFDEKATRVLGASVLLVISSFALYQAVYNLQVMFQIYFAPKAYLIKSILGK